MSRKWYALGLMVFAAACGGAEDDEFDDLETIDTQEQTLPATPTTTDTTMMMGDTTMRRDTLGQDTMGM